MTEKPKPKGRKSWQPTALLPTPDIPGFQKRFVNVKDPDNYARRLADGWKPYSEVTNGNARAIPSETLGDGKPLTTVTEHRGSVLMVLPDEDYEAHREYFRGQTKRQTAGLRQRAEARNRVRAQAGEASNLYGEISIERTIIK